MEAFDKIRGHTIYAKVLPRNPTMIDLGANHGDFSGSFLAKFGGDITLYEANPKLAKRLASNPSLRVFNIAVAGHSDTVRFNIAANDEASSILELPDNSVYNATKTETVEVPANTLDAICDKIDKPIIDLIKIDIEGAEIEVLKSCSIETLRRIGQITVEFHCDPSFGFDLLEETESVLKRMQNSGFVVLDFSGGNKNNVLFINRGIHKVSGLRERIWMNRLHPPLRVARIWSLLPDALKKPIRKVFTWFGVETL